MPRALLLGQCYGYRKGWHQKRLKELARGTLLLGILLHAPSFAVATNHTLIPIDQLQAKGLRVSDLAKPPSEPLKRVLWRLSVRARDAFAQGRDFVDDLPRQQARHFKQWWIHAVFLLGDLERHDYDVQKVSPSLNRLNRLHILWMSLFGKGGFK